jgi:type IV fimbrial biogenesis protein FimT
MDAVLIDQLAAIYRPALSSRHGPSVKAWFCGVERKLLIWWPTEMKTMRNNSGFSLIELMIVIGVVAILSAVAVPNMLNWRAGANLRGAVENLRGDLRLAKLAAVKESAFVVVTFDAGRYQIFIDNGAGANSGNWQHDSDERILRVRQLASGIQLDSTGFAGGQTRFNDRGLPENLGQVRLVGSDGKQRLILLNRLGRLVVQ